jgi:hypothetical protein
MTDIDNAVTSKALTADQATVVLAALAAGGTWAVQTAAAGEALSLVSRNYISATNMCGDISNAVTSRLLTANQGLALAQAIDVSANAAIKPTADQLVATLGYLAGKGW